VNAEDLFEAAPCGLLVTGRDGTIERVNRTFEAMTGHARADLTGARRFQDLLAPGARIYHETHMAPLLSMQGWVREIAVEILRADGSRLPALVNSTVSGDAVHVAIFSATDRRRYEGELLEITRREQGIAQEVQRSLLSGAMPKAPGLEIDAAYRPATADLEVGGDWYDAFWLEPGESVGLVVGDVVGRGITAATTMGQLRSAVRALAGTGLGPAALVEALDAFAGRHGVGRMTTLVYAELALATGELRYICAGHPPPVVAPPGADPHPLWDGRSIPLDCYALATARDEGVATLAPGTVLVLYTDGLVERRTGTLTAGIERLLASLADHSDEPLAQSTAALVHELRDPEHADDVCVLAARLRGA
jgi:PAS domain S-box-containing protein